MLRRVCEFVISLDIKGKLIVTHIRMDGEFSLAQNKHGTGWGLQKPMCERPTSDKPKSHHISSSSSSSSSELHRFLQALKPYHQTSFLSLCNRWPSKRWGFCRGGVRRKGLSPIPSPNPLLNPTPTPTPASTAPWRSAGPPTPPSSSSDLHPGSPSPVTAPSPTSSSPAAGRYSPPPGATPLSFGSFSERSLSSFSLSLSLLWFSKVGVFSCFFVLWAALPM